VVEANERKTMSFDIGSKWQHMTSLHEV